MYFLSVVLIGTIYPIFLEVITANKISVGPPFYNKLIIPFLIPFLLAMAIGPKLNWIKSDFKDKFYRETFIVSVHTRNLAKHVAISEQTGTSIGESSSYNKWEL